MYIIFALISNVIFKYQEKMETIFPDLFHPDVPSFLIISFPFFFSLIIFLQSIFLVILGFKLRVYFSSFFDLIRALDRTLHIFPVVTLDSDPPAYVFHTARPIATLLYEVCW
jgi:hypothetical protein